jgi:hypothetical protein
MDDYKIIIYRGYFQYRLVSLLTYVKLLEGEGAAVVLPLASSYYYYYYTRRSFPPITYLV